MKRKFMKRKIFSFVLVLVFALLPVIVMAKIVPECGDVVNGVMANPCNFDFLIKLINNLITFLLFTIASPLMALIIIYAAWLYLSSGGNETNVTKAKSIFKNAAIGYILALAAWLIIKTIVVSLGFNGPMYLSLISSVLS